ncbi:MAG: ATPase, T2SS/T4P/T4SS family [Pirellulaceae bacterium]|nr:ATPase, T2SS/T4P/T4SS family [Pirellulaceae bacterium]
MIRKKPTPSSGGRGPEPQLPPMDFKPPVSDKQIQQGILIACRAVEQYPVVVMLLAQALSIRADQILLDCTAQGVSVRCRVDGLWENLPPMDRPTGDGVMIVIKRLCNLNPTDRRSRQNAKLGVSHMGDWIVEFTSQGVPTGERAVLRIEPKKPALKTLGDLGMREKLQEQLKALLNGDDALFMFSAPPGHGLPTQWRVGLEAADRFIRDFHSIEDEATAEPEMINIGPHHFNRAAGETPMTVLKSLLLKQPDVLVIPDFVDNDTVEVVCDQIIDQHRFAITRMVAGSAVEATLKLLAAYPAESKRLIQILSGVINQRLVRRLCDKCKQAFPPSPQLLQKLGIPPGRVSALYQPFVPPPPEQRVDAKGNPIEIEICTKCNGRGYFGRMAIFELLTINDEIRKVLLQKPTAEAVLQVARKQGFLTIQEEGVLAVATGATSLQELQRVLAPPKT